MSQTIELPDPLFAEISGYASRVAESPVVVLGQAWEEFRLRHPAQAAATPRRKLSKEELLEIVETFGGTISLPLGVDDTTLIAEARMEKYGPL